MKKLFFTYPVTALSILLLTISPFFGCTREEPAKLALVSTIPVTNITTTTATSGGDITSNGGAEILANGVCWNTTVNPAISDSKTVDPVGIAQFVSSLSGLTAGTTYHVRAYATNSVGTAYGADMTFSTLGQSPSSVTQPATNITVSGATLNGSVNANYLSTIVTFDYGLTTSYGSTATATQSPVTGNTVTVVSADISGLTSSTTYHYRVKTVNSLGTIYGDDLTFTTLNLPTVSTTSISSIQGISAISGGKISSDGGATVTGKGVCWNTTGSPTISDNITNDGTGTGSFASSLTGLLSYTTYYVRAYATNIVGTAYGNQLSFTTRGVPPTNGLVAYYPFNGNANDASGNGNNGTVNGATLSTDRFGKLNSAYSFNGISDFIEIPPSTSINTANMNNISISVWVNVNKFNGYNRIVNMSNKTDNINLDMAVNNGGVGDPTVNNKIVFQNYTGFGNDNPIVWDKDTTALHNWYHVVAIMDFVNKTAYLYVNGNLVTSYTGTIATRPNNPYLDIGRPVLFPTWLSFDGIIDDIRIYNRSLSSAEILQLFKE